jgi:hypothetical protein
VNDFTWVGWLVCLKVPRVAGGGSNSASQDSHKLLPFAPCQIQKEVSKDKLIVRHFAIACTDPQINTFRHNPFSQTKIYQLVVHIEHFLSKVNDDLNVSSAWKKMEKTPPLLPTYMVCIISVLNSPEEVCA